MGHGSFAKVIGLIALLLGSETLFAPLAFANIVQIQNEDHWMAVMGDSFTTGALSGPDFELSLGAIAWNAAQIALGVRAHSSLESFPPEARMRFSLTDVAPASRVVYASSEYAEAWAKGVVTYQKLEFSERAARKIDYKENTFGYLIGRKLGIKASDIVFLGHDGAHISAIDRQFARFGDVSTSTLPPLILMLFAGNDLCDRDSLTDEIKAHGQKFRATLEDRWLKVMSTAKPHRLGTRIVIIGAPPVETVFTNEILLSQKIPFEGSEITCQQMRTGDLPRKLLTKPTVKAITSVCPSILGTKPTDTEKIKKLSDVQSEFTTQWLAIVAKLNETYGRQGFTFTYLAGKPSDGDVVFAGDTANDCFHPSIQGHIKYADFILRNLGL